MTKASDFIERVERAKPDEFARLVTRPTSDEEIALRSYFGDDRYERMHNLALRGARSKSRQKGNVVVLHGIMGAELSLIDRRSRAWHVWVKYHRIVRGYLKYLRLADDGRREHYEKYDVRPTGMFKRYYGELLLSLSRDWNVRAFWYDWRKPLSTAAVVLRSKLMEWFGKHEPVHLVAHSMGGLVARTFVMEHADVWQGMADGLSFEKGGRLVMLGTPNHGSFAIPQIICGLERKVQQLELLDLHHAMPQILEIVNSFPGSYQMLPSPHKLPKMKALYDAKTYKGLGVSQDHLDEALRHHDRLAAAAVDPARMIYVAGGNQVTLSNLKSPESFDDAEAYRTTTAGDCRVTHYLGVLDELVDAKMTYRLEVDHGELTTDGRIVGALSTMLREGKANLPLLAEKPMPPQKEAADAAGEKARRALLAKGHKLEGDRIAALERRQRTRGIPQEEDLEQIEVSEVPAFDSEQAEFEDVFFQNLLTATDKPDEPEPPAEDAVVFELSLAYGDIGQVDRAAWPSGRPPDQPIDAVAVGHYIGVPPAKSELALDRVVTLGITGQPLSRENEGVLTQLTNRGTLRGELGQPFILPHPVTAIGPEAIPSRRVILIAGMGYPSRFGPPELTVLARETCWTLTQLRKRHLACVLIGSGEGNITVADAVSGWIDGIHQALSQDDDISLVRVTFIEYNATRLQEINEELDRELRRQAEQGSFEHRNVTFRYRPWPPARIRSLIAREKARRLAAERLRPAAGPPQEKDSREDFANRVTIDREGDSFWFGALTSDASIPQREIAVSPALVDDVNDQLVRAADLSRQYDLGRLFERLIIPRDLRSRLKSKGPLVLQLDTVTARIHWEMMAQSDPLLDGNGDTEDNGAHVKFANQFLGTARGLTRQLRTGFAPAPDPPPPRRRLLRVLVVADPAADAPLPGAEQEGAEVADLFESFNGLYGGDGPNRVQVTRLFGPRRATPTNVMSHLMLQRYDVLHYAGHCFFDDENPAKSGWVFSNRQILSAYELNRIDRVPRLVFSNACESGITPDRSEERSTAMAPSFAETFFARGVLNFVCTAWPVEDEPARIFARELYGHLIGVEFKFHEDTQTEGYGKRPRAAAMYDAMREARKTILDSGVRTWGAYQHYGNPFTRLFHADSFEGDSEGGESDGGRPEAGPRSPRPTSARSAAARKTTKKKVAKKKTAKKSVAKKTGRKKVAKKTATKKSARKRPRKKPAPPEVKPRIG